jgi:predicted PurR-regulated permease PerM
MKQWLERFITLQPAAFRSLVVTFVALLASLGIFVSPQISDNFIAFVGALSTLIAGLWIRNGVTPNSKVLAYVPDPDRPRVIAPGEATTTARDSAILDAVATVGRHAATE